MDLLLEKVSKITSASLAIRLKTPCLDPHTTWAIPVTSHRWVNNKRDNYLHKIFLFRDVERQYNMVVVLFVLKWPVY